MNVMRVESVQFKRTEAQDWEDGILVNEGDGPMVDMQGRSSTPASGIGARLALTS